MLPAYVIMSNHYHLAVEAPELNLVDGVKWLQSTFSTRFNRLRNERDHVFPGRYMSILIGEERPLLGICQLKTFRDCTLSVIFDPDGR